MKILKKIFEYIGLLLFGIFLSIAVLEFGVRLLGAKPQTYLRKFSQYHPTLGWEKTPNAEGEFIRGDVKIYEQMNSHGLRDDEYPYEKAKDNYRILVLGDSFTEGYDVELNNVFVQMLERMLNDSLAAQTGYRFEVINAGTGGYSTDQEFLFYQTEGYKYNPDLVILMVYAANDIFYNIKNQYGNYYKPLFEVQNDSLYLTNIPLPEQQSTESVKNIFRELALYPIVVNMILTQFPKITSTLHRWGLISASTVETTPAGLGDKTLKAPSSFSIFERKDSEITQKAWKVTELLLRDLNNSTRINNSKLIVFSIPDRFQVYPKSWEATKLKFNVSDETWDPAKPDSILSGISDRYGFKFINYVQYLKKNNLQDEPMYNVVHWNIRGNQLAAQCLYSVVTEHINQLIGLK